MTMIIERKIFVNKKFRKVFLRMKRAWDETELEAWHNRLFKWSMSSIELCRKKAREAPLHARELITNEWTGYMVKNSDRDDPNLGLHLKRRKQTIKKIAVLAGTEQVVSSFRMLLCCLDRVGVWLPVEIKKMILDEAKREKKEEMEKFGQRLTRRL